MAPLSAVGPPNDQAAPPLTGHIVLEFGQVYNGPYCGLLLGFMGARVIKVEPPRGDVLRSRARTDRIPIPYLMLNSNKESVVLDLKTRDGRDVALQLAQQADVLIENFAPGVMDRLGLGWGDLQPLNPGLVYASSSGFGLSGPYRDLPAMDLTIQAMAGIMDATGLTDGSPLRCAPAIGDFLGGTHLAVAVLAALLARRDTGLGQQVEVSMHEAAVMAMASPLSAVMEHGPGAIPRRSGNRHPGMAIAPYNVYRTSDGHVAVFCVTERHWTAIAEVICRTDLTDDPRFATNLDRAQHMDEVDTILQEWAVGRSREEAVSRLREARVPCAPVLGVEEVIDDPHLVQRGAWTTAEERGRSVRLPVAPFRLHGTPLRGIDRVAPTLGEHTETVLADVAVGANIRDRSSS